MVTPILNVYPIKARDWVVSYYQTTSTEPQKAIWESPGLGSLTRANSPAPIKSLGSKDQFSHP